MGLHRRIRENLLRPTNIPAAIAAVATLICGALFDHQNGQLTDERARAEVLSQANLIRAKLEGDIHGDVQLVRGLAAEISSQPDMTQSKFAEVGANLVRTDSQVKMVAGAPNLVISLVHPLRGNEAVMGLDYRSLPSQFESGLRARDSGDVVLVGPVDIVQGGRALIARLPVFTHPFDGARAFWGLVSAVIDLDKLYRDCGLVGPDARIEVAITGTDGLGKDGIHFFGDAAIERDHPVTVNVRVPSGSWTIAATPRGGWEAARPSRWLLRLALLAGGLVIVVPTWLIGRLVEERRAHFLRMRDREQELERLSQRLELALDASKVGVWEVDVGAQQLVWDDRMNELYNYPADGGPRGFTHWRDRVDEHDLHRAIEEFELALKPGRYESQFRIRVGEGRSRVVRAIGKAYVSSDGATKMIGVAWDITSDVALTEDLQRSKALTEARNAELEAARAHIEYNSLHDFLTRLPNRMYMDRALGENARRCATTGGGVVLLHIDLDGFKQINDTLGHAAGDAMLVHSAKVIRDNVREDDFVARTGGDEFVVLCKADAGIAGFDALARRIIASGREPIVYEGHECRLGMSIGIAGAFGGAVDRRQLLVNADLALYRAKSLGRNRFEFYTEALQEEILNSKQTADDIVRGLERGEFFPYYQPQFDARTHQIVGVEALARWRHPTRGLVTPNQFIPIAEELTVIGAIDRVVLEQALKQFRLWRAGGHTVPRLSVNVSLRRLHDESLLQGLRDLEIEPGILSFELVETIYLDERDERFSHTIDQIKALGVDIEIDDFGTGYASIVSLTKLKPRRLKIDRQLVTPVTRSDAQRRLVQAIVDIGRSLDIEIVAEGVETLEHARLLRDLGCDILQGYAFAEPMSGEEFEQFMASRTRLVAS